VRTVAALRARVREWNAAGQSVALVPTMGALHAGHLALVAAGLACADAVVASIFVNPTQFGPNEDFSRYPRREAEDAAALAGAGCHLLFAPTVEEMYPAGFASSVQVAGLTAELDGAHRPGHFDGVATVVSKLLNQAGADFAMFGEKDYQQLKVVTRMAKDLDLPIKVIGVPTVRERDGLAMSSRNVYLSAEERQVAPTLYKAMKQGAASIRAGADIAAALADGEKMIRSAGFALDYLEARHAETLAPIGSREEGPVRMLVAARLGTTRLIDNIAV